MHLNIIILTGKFLHLSQSVGRALVLCCSAAECLNDSVVNTGEYYGLVGPGESHVMLDIDTDQSRSTGHH